MAPTGIAGPVRPEASLFHDENRVAESGETTRMALDTINNGVSEWRCTFRRADKTRRALVPHGMSSS